MSDKDRLVRIDRGAERQQGMSRDGVYSATITISEIDYLWLLARVRALSAEVAALRERGERDARVVRAILALKANESKQVFMNDQMDFNGDWLGSPETAEEEHNALVGDLDAALAAREQGEVTE